MIQVGDIVYNFYTSPKKESKTKCKAQLGHLFKLFYHYLALNFGRSIDRSSISTTSSSPGPWPRPFSDNARSFFTKKIWCRRVFIMSVIAIAAVVIGLSTVFVIWPINKQNE